MPAQHSRCFLVVFLLLLGALLWWPGEVVAESVINEKINAVDQYGRPVLSSEQVLQVMLKMAEAIPKRRQLTPEVVKEVTGIKLTPWKEEPKWYSSNGPTTAPGWFYNFGLYPEISLHGHFMKVSFPTGKGVDERTLSFDSICRPTLGDVDRALHKIGYMRQGSLSGQRIHYKNGDISILIVSTFTRSAYCVRYLRIFLPDSINQRAPQ